MNKYAGSSTAKIVSLKIKLYLKNNATEKSQK